jgi:xylulokinase
MAAPVHESPEITGRISDEAARLTGLAAGTPVVGGGGDQAAGAVGCGVVQRGVVSSTVGTSGVVFAHSDEPFFDPQMRIQTFCHAVPGAWHLMGCVLSAGGSLRYYRDTFASPDASYDALTEAAKSAPAGCEGLLFLPYLTGERTPHPDPNARGVFFGATLRSEKSWYCRAVLEGVAFALKDSFTLLDQIGVPVREVRASGGGARSPLWLQIQASVIGQPHLTLHADEGPAFGAALPCRGGRGRVRVRPRSVRGDHQNGGRGPARRGRCRRLRPLLPRVPVAVSCPPGGVCSGVPPERIMRHAASAFSATASIRPRRFPNPC